MTSRHGEHMVRWLLAVVTFVIVYGSLYPFRFEPAEAGSVVELFSRLTWARTTRSDIAANVLLYLPFGACLGWMLAARLGGPLAVLAAAGAGLLLATGIEVAQIYETRRVASLSDLLLNGLGTFMGSALSLALRAARHGFRRHPFSSLLAEPIAAALLLLWVGYRLAPFALTLDPRQWAAAIAPLVHGDWLAPADTLRYLVPWLVSGYALRSIQGEQALVARLAAVMLAVLAGLVLVAGRKLVPAEIVAMAVALAVTVPLSRLAPAGAAALLAGLLAVVIAIQGLVPFDFRLDPDAFGLVPFRDALTRYRATNLADMFQKCFLYGALVWLLVRSGASALAATLSAGSLVLGVEFLQAWLPGKAAEITDPLLVVVAGGLVAVFDNPGPGSAVRRLRI